MGFPSARQVECVIQTGKIINQDLKTRGGELRLCSHKGGVLKQLQWKDKLLYVRYKRDASRIIILDIIVKKC